ncbi:Trafficking protein particle complex subunit 6B [Plasmodiophora brassicae]
MATTTTTAATSAASDLIARSSLDLLLVEMVRRPSSEDRLDAIGSSVGVRFAERAIRERARFNTQLDVLKFLCKEIWNALFNKTADRLRTNNAGIFAVQDNNLRWLQYIAHDDERVAQASAQAFAAFTRGLIRGALRSMGVDAIVTAEIDQIPQCVFHINATKSA